MSSGLASFSERSVSKLDIPGTKLGNFDSLTGLLCRSAFEVDKTHPAFTHCVSAVFITDFDHFSEINKAHGRSVGDFVLAVSAARLSRYKSCYSQTSYRYEGDRFIKVLLAEAPLTAAEAKTIAKDIQRELERGIALPEQTISLSCTVTAAVRDDGVSLNQILTEAMLYSAEMKLFGPGQCHLLCPEKVAEA